jgi:hypothetical protein
MPHDLHTWLEIGQFGVSLLAVPALKFLYGIKNDIAEFKLYAARTYVTKDELRDHKCGS